MTARVSERGVAAIAATLSGRDRAVVSDLWRVRLLTARQVERLHFRIGSQLTQARRARRTLERLTNLGVLHRFERRIGGARAGSAGFVYGLGAVGQRIANGSVEPERRARRPWEPSASFMAHVLAVSELYVQLREAERVGGIELLAFDGEPKAWRSGAADRVPAVKPDAYVALAVGDFEELRFVEVDLGTESLNVIRRKAQVYVRYWQSGVEQLRTSAFPRVTFLARDEGRVNAIVGVLGELAADEWQLFQVGTLDKAVDLLGANGIARDM